MNEPQVWTLIGVFGACMIGLITLVGTTFVRVLRSEIGGLRSDMGRIEGRLEAKIDGLQREMNVRFESVDRRLDGLDRDVRTLFRHAYGIDGE